MLLAAGAKVLSWRWGLPSSLHLAALFPRLQASPEIIEARVHRSLGDAEYPRDNRVGHRRLEAPDLGSRALKTCPLARKLLFQASASRTIRLLLDARLEESDPAPGGVAPGAHPLETAALRLEGAARLSRGGGEPGWIHFSDRGDAAEINWDDDAAVTPTGAAPMSSAG